MRAAIAEARPAFGMPGPGQAPGQQELASERPRWPSHRPDRRRPDRAATCSHWSVAGRHRGPRGGPPGGRDRRPAIVGRRTPGRRRPGLVPERRAAPSRGALDRCADLLDRHGGHAAAAGFEFAETAGTPSSSGSCRRGEAPPRSAADRWRWTSRCRRASSTTGCTATSPGSPRAGPATRSRWSPSWPDRADACARPTVGIPSSCFAATLDVLDGIAFGRAGPCRRPVRGRPRRRRRAAARAARSAASSRSSWRSATCGVGRPSAGGRGAGPGRGQRRRQAGAVEVATSAGGGVA